MATRAVQQVITYYAWNTSTNAYVTGDSANHTTSWCKDGTRSATTNATAEVDATNLPGLYKVTMTSTETDCLEGVLGGKSSTANVVLIGTMVAFDQIPNAVPGAAGGVQIAGSNAATTFASLAVTGNLTTGNISNAGTTTLTGAVSTGAMTLASLTSTGTLTAGNISVGGTTTLTGAVSTGALTIASGTVTGNLTLGNLTNNGVTTLTGAVTATNASNNITGVTVGNVTLAATQGNITMNIAGTITTATNLTNAPTAGDFTSTMKTSIGTAVAASAVASVTGNVGGNVLGSVGSVFGAVGSVTGNIGGSMAGSVVGSVGSIAGVTFPTNFSTLAIDGSGFVTYNNAAAPTANANADALLGRNVAGGSSSGRLVKEAFYVLRNKVDTGAGSVYGTDDSTVAWSFVATTAAGNPITVIDPA